MCSERDLMPIVTFIVPVFNHARYVVKCLDSLRDCAAGLPCELLITDDGSSDNSPAIVSAWIDKYRGHFVNIQFRSRENKGVTKTLNEMIVEARGEFIALTASDDYFVVDGFRARLDFARSNPEFDIFLGDAIVVNECDDQCFDSSFFDFHSANKKALVLGGEYLIRELVYRWSVAGPCGLIRSTVYSKIGGYNELLRVEDREFYLRALSSLKICFYDRCVAAYRIHSNNYSLASNNRAMVNAELSVVNVRASNSFSGLNLIYLRTYGCNHCVNGPFSIVARKVGAFLRAVLRSVFDLELYFIK